MPTRPDRQPPRALAYAVAPGMTSGMGHHAAQVLAACATPDSPLLLFGPAPGPRPENVESRQPPPLVGGWRRRYTWLRYLHGRHQYLLDRGFGRWLAGTLPRELSGCYVFTQIAAESLEVLRRRSVPTLLDNPNGHIRHFREVVQREAERWLGGRYPGHPTAAMAERVEHEYDLAGHVRVASRWSAETLVAGGVARDRVSVVPHSVDLDRFRPDEGSDGTADALHVVFVGGLTLGKGFAYLLTALRALRTKRITLEIVGGTGDPWCRRLFDRLSANLDVTLAPGDPLGPYRRADLLVLPTLHDGFGYVVAEAMACGVAVITTSSCGAAEWIEPGVSGWIVPAGDQEALTAAIDAAAGSRAKLREMGRQGRRTAEMNSAAAALALRQLVADRLPQS